MTNELMQTIASRTVGELLTDYPVARDFFHNLNLPPLPMDKALEDALLIVSEEWLEEFGLRRFEIPEQLASFLQTMTAADALRAVSSLTIIGGQDKDGNPESAELQLRSGSVAAIVGPTGSGKSRLLADIECLAQGDTPTKRCVLIDGAEADEDMRFRMEGKLVAQLSQNMNFVMDVSVAEFLEMHMCSRSRGSETSLIQECFECANSLAGEKFTLGTKVTQLSGGQSRALMIADCAYISLSPIVLIDEIENAGVDRRNAVDILMRREKIVLISTHDPLLALGADLRIIIRNGGIYKILETSVREKESLHAFQEMDMLLGNARTKLRAGERLEG
ncbi:MAG: ATP-binding cassette domain-containing protein [Oscillospiraceae bacterium]|nr:ATP-binding cassette domain-containing protein [Oscillospiraceae bacterium]